MQDGWGAAATEHLLIRAKGGDPEAFAALVASERARLLQAAWAILGDADEAEDSVQEALLRAFHRLGQVREPAAFRGWLRRIVFNQAKNRLRQVVRRRRHEQSVADPAEWDALLESLDPGRDGGPLADLEAVDAASAIAALVATLPIRQRQVLSEVSTGRSVGEVAKALGMAPGAVRMALHRGRRSLAAVLLENAPFSPLTRRVAPMTDHVVRFSGTGPIRHIAQAFQAAHPGWQSVFVDVQDEWDICFSDLWWPMASLDRSRLQPLPSEHLGEISVQGRAAFSAEGRLWGVPLTEQAGALFFNPELFERADIPLPTRAWTWEDALGAIAAFAARGKAGLAAGAGLGVALAAMAQLGPTRESALEALQLAERVSLGHGVAAGRSGEWVHEPFYRGEVPMAFTNLGGLCWALSRTNSPHALRSWDAVIPRVSAGASLRTDWYCGGLLIGTNARHAEEVTRFAVAVATGDVLDPFRFGGVPANRSAAALKACAKGLGRVSQEHLLSAQPAEHWARGGGAPGPLIEAALRGDRPLAEVAGELAAILA